MSPLSKYYIAWIACVFFLILPFVLAAKVASNVGDMAALIAIPLVIWLVVYAVYFARCPLCNRRLTDRRGFFRRIFPGNACPECRHDLRLPGGASGP